MEEIKSPDEIRREKERENKLERRKKYNERRRKYLQTMAKCKRCGEEMRRTQLRWHNFAHKNCNQEK